jgi:hypothetical protein
VTISILAREGGALGRGNCAALGGGGCPCGGWDTWLGGNGHINGPTPQRTLPTVRFQSTWDTHVCVPRGWYSLVWLLPMPLMQERLLIQARREQVLRVAPAVLGQCVGSD